ncbi:hypothetical protein P7K49_011057, partial [Saguinus oedipus]
KKEIHNDPEKETNPERKGRDGPCVFPEDIGYPQKLWDWDHRQETKPGPELETTGRTTGRRQSLGPELGG